MERRTDNAAERDFARAGRRPQSFVAWTLALWTLLWRMATPARAQITFPAATPISAGNFIVREQPFLASGGQGYQAYENPVVVVYGLSPDIAFILDSNTFVYQTARVSTAGETPQRSALGFGDTEFVFRYTIFQQDDIGSTLRVAPIVGTEIPTWMNDQSDRYGTLPPPLQPGWSSWDPLFGDTFTWQTLDWYLAADIVYQFGTPSQGYQFGNVFHVDGAARYRLWPWPLSVGVPAEIWASLEANLIYAAKDQADGVVQANTGGLTLFLDPAIIYTTAQYGIVLSGLLPALQRLNGTAIPIHYEILLLFRWSFFTPYHL